MEQNYVSFAFPFDEVRAPASLTGELPTQALEKVASRQWHYKRVDQVCSEWGRPCEAFHFEPSCGMCQHLHSASAKSVHTPTSAFQHISRKPRIAEELLVFAQLFNFEWADFGVASELNS